MPEIGQTISHYKIVEKLGAGGMGVIYKAEDTRLGRFVALKFLAERFSQDRDALERFQREARAASALNHPNIVHIYDITADQGVDFIAMEYVEGKTLEQQIGRRSLRLNDVLKYAVQVADALAKAHAAGIVHRDLKPGNIMVNQDGAVKVLDFGLAKLTEQVQADEFGSTATADAAEPVTKKGTIVGTVAYMSPEQAEGKPVDPRSDIFSFGSVLYEMATGRRAFQGDSKIATLSSILHQEPAPVSQVSGGIPQELERIIARCMKKDPARRFQHMADVKVVLEELKEKSESGRLLSQSSTAAKERRSSKLIVATAIAAGTLVLAAAILYHFWKPGGTARTSNPAGQATHRQISFTGNANTPVISPDRTVVAYTDGDIGEYNTLMLQDLSGGRPVEMLRASAGMFLVADQWSPDGTEQFCRLFCLVYIFSRWQ